MHARLPVTAGRCFGAKGECKLCSVGLSRACPGPWGSSRCRHTRGAFPVGPQECCPPLQQPGTVAAGVDCHGGTPPLGCFHTLEFTRGVVGLSPTACLRVADNCQRFQLVRRTALLIRLPRCCQQALAVEGVVDGIDVLLACTLASVHASPLSPLSRSVLSLRPASRLELAAMGRVLWLQREDGGQSTAGVQGLCAQARASAHSSCLAGFARAGFLASLAPA